MFLLTLTVYIPALGNGFVNWDDDLYVTHNLRIRSLDGELLRYAFGQTDASNWHPLTWLSHAADWALWGGDPLGHHLTSVLLHAANSLLVVLIAAAVLDRILRTSARSVLIASALAGLLFGLHPIHVESAAWVAERKDVLCAFFFLLALLSWLRHARARSQAEPRSPWVDRWWLASLGLFVLALLSKPMAVSFPVILLALDGYPYGRLADPARRREAVLGVTPFLGLAAGASFVALHAQRAGGAVVPLASAGIETRLLVAANAVATYLGKLVVPLDLLPFYPHPRNVSLASPRHLAAAALVVLATAAAVAWARRRPWALTAWLAFLALLAPVLGIVQAGGQAMADRYVYLPSVPPFLVAGASIAWTLERAAPAARRLVVGATAAALVALAMLTLRQIAVWHSSVELWSHVIEREPSAVPLAYYNRGQAFLEEGLLDHAVADYTKAFALNPGYRDAVYNRGIALERKGDLAGAIADFEEAVRLDPAEPRAHNNLGVALARSGDLHRAIASFAAALAVSPDFAEARLNRGLALAQAGRLAEAREDLARACTLGTAQACSILTQLRAAGTP